MLKLIKSIFKKLPKEDLQLLKYKSFPFLLISMEDAAKIARRKLIKTPFGKTFEGFYPPEELNEFEMRFKMPYPYGLTGDVPNRGRVYNPKLQHDLENNKFIVGKSFDIPQVLRCEILDYYAYLVYEHCQLWTFGKVIKKIKKFTYIYSGLIFNADGKFLVIKNGKRVYDNLKVDRMQLYRLLKRLKKIKSGDLDGYA